MLSRIVGKLWRKEGGVVYAVDSALVQKLAEMCEEICADHIEKFWKTLYPVFPQTDVVKTYCGSLSLSLSY